ncbi:DNA-binding NarL/FixJ family response regulator [Mycolicibacterium iranicum]|uniref:DNA-binding NarL/FixJ family response regulator n=1 Tax=Mycolicibacterium iranicum TaxID=912594 RepID=A0A839QFI1_MYCIR|nr:LuxR family transcriptional regulator [Mycolicibacterium iranicum]MBB2993265.1 DNA-binding NarL/FixJ family response regulator [Mycolicibacterium iranicum]
MGDELDRFLSWARHRPAGLLIEGEAGIGKTTLWAGVVDRGTTGGFHVLSARAEQAESGLAHGTVADLLAAVDPAVLAALPDVQRLAADRVLLRDPGVGGPTDERVTAAALLGAVHALSETAPVLLAVDDVQWLDPSSLAVLAFVARRVRGPVGVAVTERSGDDASPPASAWLQVGTSALVRVRVAPMSLGALHTMLTARLGRRFSRPAIVRIAEVSGGNPLYALELARVVGSGDTRLPETLAEVVRLRVDGLHDEVRDALLVAASATVPTVDLLAAAAGTTAAEVTAVLEAAEVEGIVVIEGNRIRFTHPLLASGIYENAEPQRRREIHRRLADLKTQPELRARHLALASTRGDDATVATLDAAADSARSRGAPAAAAEFLELALRLGGNGVSRRIRAAEHHYVAGDMHRAAALLDGVLTDLRPGVLRAVALNLLAGLRTFEDDYAGAVDLLEQARLDAAGNDAVMVTTLLSLAFSQGMVGVFDEQLETARQALQIAESTGVPSLVSRALAMWVHVSCQAGHGLDLQSLERAVALEDRDDDTPIPFRATATRGLMFAMTGRLAEADEQLAEVAERCLQRGAEHDLMAVMGYRTLVALWRGQYDEADRRAADMLERAEQLGGSMVIAFSICAAAAGHRGRERRARECARAALAQGAGYPPLTVWASASLAFLEVSLGNYRQAAEAAEPLVALYRPYPGTELMTSCFLPDAVEAYVALGRLDDAEPMIAALERNGAALDRPWMLAVGNRCRGLLSAARGDHAAALDALECAMAEHDRLPMPFERARTQLVLAETLRALRRRDAGAEAAREALRQFDALGAPLWSARARKALSGKASSAPASTQPSAPRLTESERRVAELAAAGMSNRDIAETLYVSVKTVETNLTRAYRKLGIRSRAQLGTRLGAATES